VTAGLQAAKDAGIPVVGMDAGADALLATNVTSNGYAMAADDRDLCRRPHRRRRQGGDVRLRRLPAGAGARRHRRRRLRQLPGYRSARPRHPGRRRRRHRRQPRQDGSRSSPPTRKPAAIKAVWAAWDQPALGALQAIEAAGRQGEGIVITGIDANPQAREAIAAGGNFEATVAQDFSGIGTAAADAVARILGGEELKQRVIYVPTKLVTAANAAE
jgi:ribose transport system substrate-binding protein